LAAASLCVVLLALALGASAGRGAETQCQWGYGFTWGEIANGGPHTWTHKSTWRTWSNPNQWLGRRLLDAEITYEYYAPFGLYWEFVNASNNWRRTTLHVFEGPYQPGTNWRWEQWSTIGC